MTLARTVYDSSGPPNFFGTLIDHRPLCEKASNSAIGFARMRSRSAALAAKSCASGFGDLDRFMLRGDDVSRAFRPRQARDSDRLGVFWVHGNRHGDVSLLEGG